MTGEPAERATLAWDNPESLGVSRVVPRSGGKDRRPSVSRSTVVRDASVRRHEIPLALISVQSSIGPCAGLSDSLRQGGSEDYSPCRAGRGLDVFQHQLANQIYIAIDVSTMHVSK